jgi:hypothetical protein
VSIRWQAYYAQQQRKRERTISQPYTHARAHTLGRLWHEFEVQRERHWVSDLRADTACTQAQESHTHARTHTTQRHNARQCTRHSVVRVEHVSHNLHEQQPRVHRQHCATHHRESNTLAHSSYNTMNTAHTHSLSPSHLTFACTSG